MTIEEKIWEYLDGGLDEGIRHELEHSIAYDADTGALFKEISATHTMLQAQPAEHLDEAFADRVMDAVCPAVEQETEVNWLSLLGSAIPFILVFMLMVLVFMGGQGMPSSLHLNSHFISSLKLLFIIGDVVLLMYFLDEWFYTRRSLLT